jgi:hypothetical protein
MHSSLPLLIAIDQEGGKVSRLKEKIRLHTYGLASLSWHAQTNLIPHGFMHAKTAEQLAALGINLNFCTMCGCQSQSSKILSSALRSAVSPATLPIVYATCFGSN